MPLKSEVFLGVRGILRALTLVIGIVDLGITAARYYKLYSKEEFFMTIVVLAFLISLIWSIILLFDLISTSEMVKYIDAIYHFAAGLFLFIAGITFFVNVFGFGDPCEDDLLVRFETGAIYELNPADLPKLKEECSEKSSVFAWRVVAGFLGLANGVVYGVLGLFVFMGKDQLT